MSVLVYIENTEGKIKKGALEAVSYAKSLADAKSTDLISVSIGKVDSSELEKAGNYGAGKIITIDLEESSINNSSVTENISAVISENGITDLVLSNSWIGKGVSPRIAIKNDFGVVTEVVDIPKDGVVRKKGFSNKAFANIKLDKSSNIFAVSPNSFGLKEQSGSVNIETKAALTTQGLEHVEFNKDTSKVSLSDAELVVSAGRGLKGPENWNIIEELADTLGAATACSKPVSDADWRPHGEHVGQTGITVSPNLYIAIGISGAIQHLAGVSSSKKIVVINTDPEAPFFKAADYGIVGDAFEVVPKLTEAIQKVKS